MFVDPRGAELMLNSGLDTTLVPLNASNDVPLTLAFYQELQGNVAAGGATLAVTVIYAALTSQLSTIQQNQYFFCGPLAAVLLTTPTMAKYVVAPVEVDQQLDLENDRSGQTLIAQDGPGIKVAMSVPQASLVRDQFFAVISRANAP